MFVDAVVLKRGLVALAVTVVAVGCAAPAVTSVPASAPGSQAQAASPANAAIAPKPANTSLHLTSPSAGAELQAGSITVRIDYSGPTLVPGAQATKLTDYHLHYFLDADATPYIGTGLPIPSGRPDILHSAANTVTFDNVTAGSHTITVLMGGSNHIAVDPPVVDQLSVLVQ